MSGSKSEIAIVLLYNNELDKAFWAIKSAAMRAEVAYPAYEIIWEDNPAYAQYVALAGEKPQVLIEEVTQVK